MNRRFHRWLDAHEIVRLFFMVALVAAPSILLCVVGLLIAMNLDADVSHRNNGWCLFGGGVSWVRSSAWIAELEADRACHPIRGCQIQAMLPRRWFRRRAGAPAATTPRRPPEREF